MHEQIKTNVGIDTANCSTCAYLGSEDDGNYSEMGISWDVCQKFDRYQYLKPFPFKTEQKCWEPEFWHSKFAELKTGEHEEVTRAIDAFVAARDAQAVLLCPGCGDRILKPWHCYNPHCELRRRSTGH